MILFQLNKTCLLNWKYKSTQGVNVGDFYISGGFYKGVKWSSRISITDEKNKPSIFHFYGNGHNRTVGFPSLSSNDNPDFIAMVYINQHRLYDRFDKSRLST